MVKKKFVIITLLVVLLDQIVKYLINLFKPDWSIGFFRIIFVKNTGAGFGILKNNPIILGIISFIVAIIIIFNYHKIPKDNLSQIFLAMFLGGIIGNMIDRFIRKFVIDFISISIWPAFNIADAVISISVIGLIFILWNDARVSS